MVLVYYRQGIMNVCRQFKPSVTRKTSVNSLGQYKRRKSIKIVTLCYLLRTRISIFCM